MQLFQVEQVKNMQLFQMEFMVLVQLFQICLRKIVAVIRVLPQFINSILIYCRTVSQYSLIIFKYLVAIFPEVDKLYCIHLMSMVNTPTSKKTLVQYECPWYSLRPAVIFFADRSTEKQTVDFRF